MDFSHSPKVQDLQARVQAFMTEHIYPCLLYTSDAADE